MVIRADSDGYVEMEYSKRTFAEWRKNNGDTLEDMMDHAYGMVTQDREDSMKKEAAMGEALDLIIREIEKVAMCKRGIIKEECHTSYYYWELKTKKVPLLSIKARGKLFAKERAKLLKILKFRPSKDLVYMDRISGKDMYTSESLKKYNQAVAALVKHPEADEIKKYNDNLVTRRELANEQLEARTSALEVQIKEIQMGFITGSIPMSEFPDVMERFESEVH